MSVVHKIRIFLSYKKDMQFLLLEAYFFLAYGRMFKSLPFSKMSKKLGDQMDETSFDWETDQVILKNISNAIHIHESVHFLGKSVSCESRSWNEDARTSKY